MDIDSAFERTSTKLRLITLLQQESYGTFSDLQGHSAPFEKVVLHHLQMDLGYAVEVAPLQRKATISSSRFKNSGRKWLLNAFWYCSGKLSNCPA